MYCVRTMLRWSRASWNIWRTYTVAITSLCVRLCPPLIFVLFCPYNCQSHCFYAPSSDAVCTANKWERSGGKSCPVVSASICWRIQWMKDWTWICFGVAFPKSRLNSVWLSVLGHCERYFPTSHPNWILKTGLLQWLPNANMEDVEKNLGEIKIFLRRKGRRIHMTSN
jgi:hypothetical protein